MCKVFEESLGLKFCEADLDLRVVEGRAEVDDLPRLPGLVGDFY